MLHVNSDVFEQQRLGMFKLVRHALEKEERQVCCTVAYNTVLNCDTGVWPLYNEPQSLALNSLYKKISEGDEAFL